MSFELIDQILHVFIVETSVRIDDVDNVNDALLNHLERFQQLVLHYIRQRHNVQGGLVTSVMEQLNQLQCLINIFNVASDPNQIEQAFAAR
ncbi:hypothetical protein D3C81_1748280 [compost metagenome]